MCFTGYLLKGLQQSDKNVGFLPDFLSIFRSTQFIIKYINQIGCHQDELTVLQQIRWLVSGSSTRVQSLVRNAGTLLAYAPSTPIEPGFSCMTTLGLEQMSLKIQKYFSPFPNRCSLGMCVADAVPLSFSSSLCGLVIGPYWSLPFPQVRVSIKQCPAASPLYPLTQQKDPTGEQYRLTQSLE